MAAKKRRFTSKAQQRFVFARAKTDPKFKAFAKRWAHNTGEGRPAGSAKSKAAYARLPRRKGVRRR